MPSRSRSTTGRELDVAAELLAHRGEHLLGEGVLLARTEAHEERGRQDVGRHPGVDRLLDRPPPLPRVLDDPRVLVERRMLDEGLSGEVEEPRAHDAPAPPELRDVAQVEVVSLV